MPQVKICGVCRPEDGRLASEMRADFVGVILSAGFGRSQPRARAAEIYAAAVGPRRVGVFVDEPVEAMLEAVEACGLDVVQLHGDEPPAVVAALAARGVEAWKVIRPRGAAELLAEADCYAGAAALLLDGQGDGSAGIAGGTGARFAWAAVAEVRERLPVGPRLVVAGGLSPANVAEAVRLLRPDVVDVSSGVERVRGEKSPEAVAAFVAAARAAGMMR